MRSVIFRTLAGLLAVGIAFATYFRGDDLPLHRFAVHVAMSLVFAVYAVMGAEPAERVLGCYFSGWRSDSETEPEERGAESAE